MTLIHCSVIEVSTEFPSNISNVVPEGRPLVDRLPLEYPTLKVSPAESVVVLDMVPVDEYVIVVGKLDAEVTNVMVFGVPVVYV